MSIVSLKDGLAREARAGMCAGVSKILPVLALGTAVIFCASDESRADSGNEWLRATFAKPAPTRAFAPPRKLGAYVPAAERPQRRRSKNVRVASLGPTPMPSAPSGSATGSAGVRWVASSSCLASSLRSVITHIAANFGSVRVSSTCRSHKHNRRVGGARRADNQTGSAAHVRVLGKVRATLAYLRSTVGGLKHYGGGRFHIDTGPRRPM